MTLRKWTKERCAEEARKYTTRGAFQNGSPAYQAAQKRGWLDDVCVHMKRVRKRWTKETCHSEALKYTTRGQFKKGCPSGYNSAQHRGWIDDICSHMHQKIRPHSKNGCRHIAAKFSSRSAFKRADDSAYNTSLKNSWLDEICEHMQPLHETWTKEKCHSEALKYNTKIDFRKGNYKAYVTAYRRKWVEDICSHMELVGSAAYRCVYEIRCDVTKQVYIGLTFNIDARTHANCRKEIKDLRKRGTYRQLTAYLDVGSAREVEKSLIRAYKNNPEWQCLNRQEGGGLGGCSPRQKHVASTPLLKFISKAS